MIDIDRAQMEGTRTILRRFVSDCEIRAYESRVNGRSQRFSDLDIALVCAEKLDHSTFSAVKDAFAESDLPIQVDVHDWHALSGSFKGIIEAGYENIEL